MGKRRRGRPIDGILLLNKPLGISSNQALQTVKAIYFAQKAGHTGSLDPMATGMLPICFGEATKFSQFLLDADKHYHVVAQLGEVTSTGDTEGDIIKQCDAGHISKKDVEDILPRFMGETQQVPSMFSALKHEGQPLYKLAREGIEIERKPRTIVIDELTILNFDEQAKQVTLSVKCSKGTYIRNLVEDIGEALEIGATVKQLHRVGIGKLPEQMIELESLEEMRKNKAFAALDDAVLPLDILMNDFPSITLSDNDVYKIQTGQRIPCDTFKPTSLIRLISEHGDFIGLAEVEPNQQLKAKRLVKCSNSSS